MLGASLRWEAVRGSPVAKLTKLTVSGGEKRQSYRLIDDEKEPIGCPDSPRA